MFAWEKSSTNRVFEKTPGVDKAGMRSSSGRYILFGTTHKVRDYREKRDKKKYGGLDKNCGSEGTKEHL